MAGRSSSHTFNFRGHFCPLLPGEPLTCTAQQTRRLREDRARQKPATLPPEQEEPHCHWACFPAVQGPRPSSVSSQAEGLHSAQQGQDPGAELEPGATSGPVQCRPGQEETDGFPCAATASGYLAPGGSPLLQSLCHSPHTDILVQDSNFQLKVSFVFTTWLYGSS